MKKRLKKLTALAITVCMLTSITACGSKKEDTSSASAETKSESVETVSESVVVEEETEEEVVVESVVEEEEAGLDAEIIDLVNEIKGNLDPTEYDLLVIALDYWYKDNNGEKIDEKETRKFLSAVGDINSDLSHQAAKIAFQLKNNNMTEEEKQMVVDLILEGGDSVPLSDRYFNDFFNMMKGTWAFTFDDLADNKEYFNKVLAACAKELDKNGGQYDGSETDSLLAEGGSGGEFAKEVAELLYSYVMSMCSEEEGKECFAKMRKDHLDDPSEIWEIMKI